MSLPYPVQPLQTPFFRVKPPPPFEVPAPQDFRFSEAAIEASRFQVPDAVYVKYRRRVLNEFGLRSDRGLKGLLRQLVSNNVFLSAYFHPTATTIEQLSRDPTGQNPDNNLGKVELSDWPYKLAIQSACRIVALPGLESNDLSLLKVSAFVAPMGLLRTWNILERSGESPMAYMNSRYGYAYDRYLRSLTINSDLKLLEMYNADAAGVMRQLLVEPAPSEKTSAHCSAQMLRLGAALAWVQVWHRESLTKRASMKA
jgi:hypothetical protein